MTYLVQIDDEIREATNKEAANIEAEHAAAAQHQAAQDAQEAAKQSARNKLAALGLTDDEINALIP